MIAIHFGECVFERAACSFSRVAFAPTLAPQRPAQFETRPAGGIGESDPSDQPPTRFLFDDPLSVAAKIPVPDDERHVPPGFEYRHRLAAKKAHDFGICTNLCVLLEIRLARESKQQSIRFQG